MGFCVTASKGTMTKMMNDPAIWQISEAVNADVYQVAQMMRNYCIPPVCKLGSVQKALKIFFIEIWTPRWQKMYQQEAETEKKEACAGFWNALTRDEA